MAAKNLASSKTSYAFATCLKPQNNNEHAKESSSSQKDKVSFAKVAKKELLTVSTKQCKILLAELRVREKRGHSTH